MSPSKNPAFQDIVKLRHKSHRIWEKLLAISQTFVLTLQSKIAILLSVQRQQSFPCSLFKGAQLRFTMSSNDAAVGLSPLSRDASQHSLLSRPLEAIKDLINDVRLLTSKESFTEVESLFAENASLREEAKTRVDETKKLTSQIEALKINSENRAKDLSDSYDKTNHEILRIHRESVSKMEAEMTNLRTQISILDKKSEEETTKTAEIQKLNQELKQKNAEYVNQCEEEVGKPRWLATPILHQGRSRRHWRAEMSCFLLSALVRDGGVVGGHHSCNNYWPGNGTADRFASLRGV
jgi:myosin heavy subunit